VTEEEVNKKIVKKIKSPLHQQMWIAS